MLGDLSAVPLFRTFVDQHFPGATTHVLVKDLSRALRLLLAVARRKEAPYEVLVRVDLDDEPTADQRAALEGFRAAKVFLTRNTQFHNKDTAPTDTAMAFVKTWPPNQARERSQVYWVENHGPLVQEVGLPAVITSYTQLHFDSVEGDYQGLSFETITSQRDMVQTLVRDPAARRLNRILLSDEEQFTGPPLFFAFREVSA